MDLLDFPSNPTPGPTTVMGPQVQARQTRNEHGPAGFPRQDAEEVAAARAAMASSMRRNSVASVKMRCKDAMSCLVTHMQSVHHMAEVMTRLRACSHSSTGNLITPRR